ncbi:MAG: DNA-binding protein [Acidobacteria bacterium]|nr:MAG: DNA-binding protein [Acidobacteriota bacterium]
MNKTDLVIALASDEGNNISKAQAARAVDTMISKIIGALKNKEKVTLVNFGTFSVVERAPRKGRNPRTNEVIKIPAKSVPKFKPGKEMMAKVK